MARTEISTVVLRSCAIASVAEDGAVDANVTLTVRREQMAVMIHLYEYDQF